MYQELINMGPGVASVVLLITVWSIIWKGFALWISATEGKKWWFIPILVLNTAGILEIIYIFFFSEAGKKYVSKFLKKVKKTKKSSV